MSRTFLLPFDGRSPRLARHLVEHLRWTTTSRSGLPTSQLIVSELVTNAVRYGLEPIRLTLFATDREIRVEVADGNAQIPHIRLQIGTQPSPGGRGLRIVELLAERWGTQPSQSGKTVWATVTEHA